ncbi:MAG: UDP-3-O-(3-hydroxymyristoyl)glucosamine N-acyltransferase [Phycisphaerales bacterium]|jgi:UDP-3-O-[3-hydroxymyristoyl] glucosamine N-acyltransferase
MRLDALAERLGATLHGDGSVEVTCCAPVDRASTGQVSFVANTKYLEHLMTTGATAVIVAPGTQVRAGVARLESRDPYFAFREAMVALHGFRLHPPPADAAPDQPDRSPLAVVHPSAEVGPGCGLHAGAVVERGARLGARCVLYPGAYVGEQVVLGDDCVLFPGATVYDRCRLGHRVTLHAHAVIGSDGFGYATHKGRHEKIPQAGIVVLEDDVEIGGGCVIERAAMEETRIGAGTKFADLISIGHGTRIGRHCLLVSLVGVSGSVEMGDYVVLGGQAGVTGHLKIGSNVQASGKAAIVTDLPDGARVGGIPAIELDAAKRNALAGRDLYGMARRLRQLEREVERLRAGHAGEQPVSKTS